jgi:SagB-type dehydrogenase family enzyme
MPDPFRHYEGAPVLDLPADPPAPEIPAADGAAFLSQLLFYSAAISASKVVPSTGDRYALRVNPSSGNLHPTEFHFFTRGLKQWPDGLYHYRPSSHMAEQRAAGTFSAPGSAPLTFLLTSIAWREAWKYRDRAYRYCLLDIGHAWQALALAARAMGRDSFAIGRFADDDIARECRLSEDEWPMLLVEIGPRGKPAPPASEPVWHGGEANQLSSHTVTYARIDEIHAATKLIIPAAEAAIDAQPLEVTIPLPGPAQFARSFGEVARTRRSALDFRGGPELISLEQLSAILNATAEPLASDLVGQAPGLRGAPSPAGRFIQLYLYAHRVDRLPPGVYRYWPDKGQLEPVRSGDQRVAAAGLSLGQDLAGNACVAFSMIADIARAVRAHGDRAYRYVHFEAGALGQRLYLAAESLGLGATGIGAFFDDEVHHYLGIDTRERQVVYHFAIGYPVEDPRLAADFD